MSMLASYTICVSANLPTFSSQAIKQLQVAYNAPNCTAFNTSSPNYLDVRTIKDSVDINAGLRNFRHDIYRFEFVDPVLDERHHYYVLPNKITLLMPPFLMRAFTMAALWPSLGRIIISPDEHNCTQDFFFNGPEASFVGTVNTIADEGLDIEAPLIAKRVDIDLEGRCDIPDFTGFSGKACLKEVWHGDLIDWAIFSCHQDDVGEIALSKFEWLTCTSHPARWSKAEQGFFLMDAVLTIMFVSFVVNAVRKPAMFFIDEVADNELDAFQADIAKVDAVQESKAQDYRRRPTMLMWDVQQISKELVATFDDEDITQAPSQKSDLALRPLMLIDFIVSDPVRCMLVGPGPLSFVPRHSDQEGWEEEPRVRGKCGWLGDGIVSAIIHFALIMVSGLPLMLFAIMLGCDSYDEYQLDHKAECIPRQSTRNVLMFLAFKDLVGCLYCISHYTRMERSKFDQQGNKISTSTQTLCVMIRRCAFVAVGLCYMVSIGYILNVFSWLILSVLLKPAQAVTLLCCIASPILFVVLGAQRAGALREKVLNSQEFRNCKEQHKKLEEMGLTMKDIIILLIQGLLLIVTLVAWAVLGFLLFTSALDNPASVVPALSLLGGSAKSASGKLKQDQSKVNALSGQIGSQIHVDPEAAASRDIDEGDMVAMDRDIDVSQTPVDDGESPPGEPLSSARSSHLKEDLASARESDTDESEIPPMPRKLDTSESTPDLEGGENVAAKSSDLP